MKILADHTPLRELMYWLLGIGCFLALFLVNAAAFSFRAHGLLLAIALLVIFTPAANRPPPCDTSKPATPRLSLPKAVGLTGLLQLALVLAFYSICHLTAFTLPIGIEPLPLFQASATILLNDWGIFPWGAYALLAAALSYVAYIKQQPASISTLLRPVLKNKPGDTISLVADTCTKITLTLTLATTLGLITMELLGIIAHTCHIALAYGARLDIMMVLLCVLQLNKSAYLQRWLNQLLKYKIPSELIMAGFLLMTLAALFCISSLLAWLSPLITPLLSPSIPFAPENWPTIWLMFMGVWWLGWAPLAAGMLAYVWRGYKIRTLMMWTLVLPITAGMLENRYSGWDFPYPFTIDNSAWNALPALLSAAILMGLFFRTSVLTHIGKATLPTNWLDYHRSPRFLLLLLLKAIIAITCLYWVSGIYVPALACLTLMYPLLLCLFITWISMFKKT